MVTRHGKSLAARLVVGADGRQSLCRDAAGIEVKRRDLNQAALTFNIGHSRPHNNISTEFHTPEGPCVFVPLPGNRCSVVWVASPKEAERLIALGDEELSEAIEQAVAFHSRPDRRRAGTAQISAFDRAAAADCQKPHRAGRRVRACGAADRRAGPQYGTARRCRYRRHRARRDRGRRRSRLASGARPLCFGQAQRRCQPHLCDRHRQPFAALGFPADADCARRRPASDRLDRPAAPARHARGAGAVVAQRERRA